MKRYILTLLSCVLALVAYGADDSNTIGMMREEGKSFYDSARDLLYELSPKEGENVARYKELGRRQGMLSKGRLDCILFAPKQIFIIEFKVDESAEKALAQINEKGYAEPYRTDGRPIVKIGVNFSSEERTIEGWKVEE